MQQALIWAARKHMQHTNLELRSVLRQESTWNRDDTAAIQPDFKQATQSSLGVNFLSTCNIVIQEAIQVHAHSKVFSSCILQANLEHLFHSFHSTFASRTGPTA